MASSWSLLLVSATVLAGALVAPATDLDRASWGCSTEAVNWNLREELQSFSGIGCAR